jgi:hypothetical protein
MSNPDLRIRLTLPHRMVTANFLRETLSVARGDDAEFTWADGPRTITQTCEIMDMDGDGIWVKPLPGTAQTFLRWAVLVEVKVL